MGFFSLLFFLEAYNQAVHYITANWYLQIRYRNYRSLCWFILNEWFKVTDYILGSFLLSHFKCTREYTLISNCISSHTAATVWTEPDRLTLLLVQTFSVWKFACCVSWVIVYLLIYWTCMYMHHCPSETLTLTCKLHKACHYYVDSNFFFFRSSTKSIISYLCISMSGAKERHALETLNVSKSIPKKLITVTATGCF